MFGWAFRGVGFHTASACAFTHLYFASLWKKQHIIPKGEKEVRYGSVAQPLDGAVVSIKAYKE